MLQGRGWESYQEMMFQLVWQPESDRKHRTSLDAMRQRWLHLAHTARKAGLERSRFWAERILRAAFALQEQASPARNSWSGHVWSQ